MLRICRLLNVLLDLTLMACLSAFKLRRMNTMII
ncbi:hypothetical protein B4U79_00823 [Dinothrombium tinctorium]|uniref:Uncharacterized protein n=1 Tax=Dinothrombium tinctorium TaxID=1965070 RepID=A0A3S3P4J1_9ACAR|nr:hypothetical protein B4U79_00823 [Dinothrombium tinctorium]